MLTVHEQAAAAGMVIANASLLELMSHPLMRSSRQLEADAFATDHVSLTRRTSIVLYECISLMLPEGRSMSNELCSLSSREVSI
jgi:hypothetical protein